MNRIKSTLIRVLQQGQTARLVKRIAVLIGCLLGLLLFFRVAAVVFWLIAGGVLLGLAWVCRLLWRAFKQAGLTT